MRCTRLRFGRPWFVVAFSLCLIVLLSLWVFVHPDVALYDCEHRYLPSMEGRFGFKGARISISGEEYKPYALVHVDAAGALGRVGFRAGDIPIAHHGGFADFCGAIRSAEEGYDPEVSVINSADYEGGGPRRSIRIPAIPRQAAQ
jgi:hypothetical protein